MKLNAIILLVSFVFLCGLVSSAYAGDCGEKLFEWKKVDGSDNGEY